MNRERLTAIWPPTASTARAAGHRQMSPIAAIRRQCLECSGHQTSEIRYCPVITCPLWPFRAGTHPYTKRGLEQVEVGQDEAVASTAGAHAPHSLGAT